MEEKAASERDVLRMVDTKFIIRLHEAWWDDVRPHASCLNFHC